MAALMRGRLDLVHRLNQYMLSFHDRTTGGFYPTPEQQETAERSKRELDESGTLPLPVVTAIEPAKPFWRAEEYHQQYFARRGGGSCHLPFSLT
mgnify:CR=1 FL=1